MDYFSILKDSDIFEHPSMEPEIYINRPTVRVIIEDSDGKLCVYSINGRTQFPGGGVEENETKEEACIRECIEEVGVEIEIKDVLGKAVEDRAKIGKRYDITFFIATVIKKGNPTTEDEIEKKVVVEWLSQEDVLERLNDQITNLPPQDPASMYAPQFNFRTSLVAFKKYLKEKN